MKIKLHRVNGLLVAFSIIAVAALPVISVQQVFAATIFEDGFESGDLSKWSPIGGNPSVTSGDAHHGTYKAVLDASGEWAQARFTFTPVDHCFMRAYVMFKSFPTTGSETPILGVYNWGWARYMSEARVANVAGTMRWKLRYYHNGAHYTVTSEQQKPVLNTWYCIEVEAKSNTITDAESRIYIDGNELTDVTQTGISNNLQITCAYIWVNRPVTHWYDCVVVDTDYIGPECSSILADMDVHPYTLNLKSEGQWIATYIELPETYDVGNIDISTVLLNDTVAVDSSAPAEIGDYDSDGIPDLTIKFPRELLISYIESHIGFSSTIRGKPLTYQVTLSLTGSLNDGTQFYGTDEIEVLIFLKNQPKPT